jgi:hypothetical protein
MFTQFKDENWKGNLAFLYDMLEHLNILSVILEWEALFVQELRGYIQKFSDWVDNEITTINTRWEATQRVMAAKLTRMTHKIAI